MNATATVVAERDGDRGTRLARLRSQAPMVLRPTPGGVYLVGGAAGPIGGDRLTLEIVVGPGAELRMRSVAAAVVLPGGEPSVAEVTVRVAPGGSLSWLMEPLVAAAGCRHRIRTRVEVEAGGRLVWREEVVLGRYGESGGAVTSRMSLDVGGTPVLRHELVVDCETRPPGAGPGHATHWGSPAVGNGARAVGSVVVVDPAWVGSPPRPALIGEGTPLVAVLPLAGPAAQVTALADDAGTLRSRLEQGLAAMLAG